MVTIEHTVIFDREVKHLAKKYRSMADDLVNLKKELLKNPNAGVDLGDGLRKVRMLIKAKGKGKSGGARVITCNAIVSVTDTVVHLLTIYDKSEISNIDIHELRIIKQLLDL